MKVPRLLTLALSLSLFGAAGAAANSLWGEFEGFSKTKVMINDEEKSFGDADTPAFLVKGSAVFPVRVLSESLQALVKWDNSAKTVSIYKPNVHMIIAKKVDNDYSIKQPFGGVKKGDRFDFAVLAQVDSLKTPINSFKITIHSPSGQQVAVQTEQVAGGQKESFWYAWSFNVPFNETGNYVVRFSIQLDEASDYTVVSEKLILSE